MSTLPQKHFDTLQALGKVEVERLRDDIDYRQNTFLDSAANKKMWEHLDESQDRAKEQAEHNLALAATLPQTDSEALVAKQAELRDLLAKVYMKQAKISKAELARTMLTASNQAYKESRDLQK